MNPRLTLDPPEWLDVTPATATKPIHSIVIYPSGARMRGPEPDPRRVAKEMFGDHATGVITLHHPLFAEHDHDPRPVYIAYVHDNAVAHYNAGDERFRLNETAWALYGGSTIYGPVVVARDLGSISDRPTVRPMAVDVANLILESTAWITDDMRARMHSLRDIEF